jgi:hypothetical protein
MRVAASNQASPAPEMQSQSLPLKAPRTHLVSTTKTVEAGFQPASDGRILASSPIATGGRDAALLAGWKPAATVLLARCASTGFRPILSLETDSRPSYH